MRIATKNLFDQGMAAMQRQQAALSKTQQQLATGRRVLTPADDPIAAGESLRTSQAQDMNTQFDRNQTSAKDALGLLESKLTSITDIYQQIRTSMIQAGNGSMSNQDRAAIATSLRANFQDLLGLANSTDGNGNYLFSGNLEKTAPFAATSTGAVYNGDQGQRVLQVSDSRQMAVAANGSALFERLSTGNGVFVTGVGPTNAGTGTIDLGTVTNATAVTGHNYQIQFNVAAGVTTYDVVDTTASTTVSSGNAYTDGDAISFDGLQMTVKGTPVNGDAFTVGPSNHQSVFSTIANAINLLETAPAASGATPKLNVGLMQSMAGIDAAFQQLQTTHTDVGAGLAEMDVLSSVNANMKVVYGAQQSKQVDVDYAAAISELTIGQQSLTAAQQSYAMVTKLSLFNYL
jgi:flagellar hook-associated protein 3 FlgL